MFTNKSHGAKNCLRTPFKCAYFFHSQAFLESYDKYKKINCFNILNYITQKKNWLICRGTFMDRLQFFVALIEL